MALGGTAAGDPRRWRDASERLAVVCPGDDADTVTARFEEHPSIVAIVERTDRGALGVTVDGIPIELVVAPIARFGTELLRATGSKAYVDALEPLPDGTRRSRRLSGARAPLLPARASGRAFLG